MTHSESSCFLFLADNTMVCYKGSSLNIENDEQDIVVMILFMDALYNLAFVHYIPIAR